MADHKRRPWESPKLGRVSLHADQVLNIGCKTVSSGTSPTRIPCYPGTCAGVGS